MDNIIFLATVLGLSATLLILMAANTNVGSWMLAEFDPGIPDMLLTARLLFDQADYVAAEAMLDYVFASEMSTVGRIKALRLLARCQMARQAFAEADKTLLSAEQLAKSVKNNHELLMVLADKCLIFMQNGENLAALVSALNALQLAAAHEANAEFRATVLAPLHFDVALLHAQRDELLQSQAYARSARDIWRYSAESVINLERAEHLLFQIDKALLNEAYELKD